MIFVKQQRQAEGIAASKARWVRFGPAPMSLPDNFHEVYQKWKHKKISVTEAAKLCGIAKSTFYNKARQYENATSKNV